MRNRVSELLHSFFILIRIQVNTKKHDAPLSLGFEDTFYLFEESHVLIVHVTRMMDIMAFNYDKYDKILEVPIKICLSKAM